MRRGSNPDSRLFKAETCAISWPDAPDTVSTLARGIAASADGILDRSSTLPDTSTAERCASSARSAGPRVLNRTSHPARSGSSIGTAAASAKSPSSMATPRFSPASSADRIAVPLIFRAPAEAITSPSRLMTVASRVPVRSRKLASALDSVARSPVAKASRKPKSSATTAPASAICCWRLAMICSNTRAFAARSRSAARCANRLIPELATMMVTVITAISKPI